MDIQVEGTSIKCSFARILVLDTWLSIKDAESSSDRHRRVFQTLLQLLPDVENIDVEMSEKKLSNMCIKIESYWKDLNRTKAKMLAKHSTWLNSLVVYNLSSASDKKQQQPADAAVRDLPSTSGQHHRKDFTDCSKRSKRRRLAELAKVDKSTVDSLLIKSTKSNTSSVEFNTDEVLSFFTEAKLTKHQYHLLNVFINSKYPNTLPSYKKVLEAKKRCYPQINTVSESSAEVELQSLLDHTTSRILESQKDVLKNINLNKELVLIGKWGFDGSTGHSEYKQKFSDSSIKDDGKY